ncbi:MAG: hypothetical protein ACKPA7_04315 [Sphaerospermopsis kisseleviana]
MDKFIPDEETLPPIGSLIIELALTSEIVEKIIQEFVDNPPIPELANLVLAENKTTE